MQKDVFSVWQRRGLGPLCGALWHVFGAQVMGALHGMLEERLDEKAALRARKVFFQHRALEQSIDNPVNVSSRS